MVPCAITRAHNHDVLSAVAVTAISPCLQVYGDRKPTVCDRCSTARLHTSVLVAGRERHGRDAGFGAEAVPVNVTGTNLPLAGQMRSRPVDSVSWGGVTSSLF